MVSQAGVSADTPTSIIRDCIVGVNGAVEFQAKRTADRIMKALLDRGFRIVSAADLGSENDYFD